MMAKLFGNPETMKFVSASSMIFFFFLLFTATVGAVDSNEHSPFVYRDFMEVARTDAGVIKKLRITNDVHGRFDRDPIDLSFITMELSSLLLPLFLNRDYVLYVHTGNARLGLVWKNQLVERNLKVGDIYRVPSGCVFYVFNTGDAQRLRLIGIMERPISDAHVMQGDDSQMIFVGGGHGNPASVLSGFDPEILRSAFKVSAEEIEELLSGQNYGPIVHSETPKHKSLMENIGNRLMLSTKNALGAMLGGHKKRMKVFNILNKKPSFHNKYGWTKVADRKDYSPLKYSDLNIFMVNLTKGTMLSPHWNPRATEIGFVTRGGGMVQIVYPNGSCAENIRVSQGDVFVVPQFYPMAQLSFGNESFEFLGFGTCSRYNRPQFLAGENSVLNILHKETAALGFGVSSDFLADMLAAQKDSVIFTCPSCAERLEEKVQREKEKREEERRKGEEEEQRKKREREEEERRKREEEERREREEERKKREEEEEERRREEEEERRKREEEEERRKEAERRKREEEKEEKERRKEERKREEEEERRREEEEEERRKEEERTKREEEDRRREEEEGEKREEEEEEMREEEERRKREEEEEEKTRKREETKERRKREEEEEEMRKEEERREREEEEEEEMREEEERREREEEEEERRKREEAEERRKREQEEERERRGGEEERRKEEGGEEREKRVEEEGSRKEGERRQREGGEMRERRREEERERRREERSERREDEKRREEGERKGKEDKNRKEVAKRREGGEGGEGEETKRREAHEGEEGEETKRREAHEGEDDKEEGERREKEDRERKRTVGNEREKREEGEREKERREKQERGKEEVERGRQDTSIQFDLKIVPRRSLHGLHS